MDAYVIRNSDGNFFDGFRDDGAPVWKQNLQSIDPYTKMKFAVRDAAIIRSTNDAGAKVVTVYIDGNGYIR